MRALLLPLVFILGACSQQPGNESQPARQQQEQASGDYASFTGPGRDRLCLFGPTAAAAVISYGSGDANCLARGRIEGAAFVPNGDEQCRVPITRDGENKLTFGALPDACAYYCGPGASLEGKTFVRMAKPEPLTDIAGDPLC